MKHLFANAGVALLATSVSPAMSATLTLGSSFAESCYHSAEARIATSRTIMVCDQALADEGLSLEDRVSTHVNRGILYLIKGRYKEANSDFDAALTLEHDTPDAWLNKGIAHLKAGDSREAMKLAQKALDLNVVNQALAYYVRGLAHEDTGDIASAYSDLVKAQQLAPKWHEPALELARYRVVGT
jgi:tetratricopeptide (TPR) repeat protein